MERSGLEVDQKSMGRHLGREFLNAFLCYSLRNGASGRNP